MKYTQLEIKLRMPKFRLSSDLKANEILQNLGVKRVFTGKFLIHAFLLKVLTHKSFLF